MSVFFISDVFLYFSFSLLCGSVMPPTTQLAGEEAEVGHQSKEHDQCGLESVRNQGKGLGSHFFYAIGLREGLDDGKVPRSGTCGSGQQQAHTGSRKDVEQVGHADG